MRDDILKILLNQERLQEVLDYLPNGNFLWKKSPNRRILPGTVAGTLSNGYIQIRIDGRIFRAHHLVWLWHNGYLPENQLDHINRKRSDNRIDNLRQASQTCNMRNRSQFKGSSKVKGVAWNKYRSQWMAKIQVNRKSIYLGLSPCFIEAVCLRLAAEQAEGWEDCERDSPAFIYVKEHLCQKF